MTIQIPGPIGPLEAIVEGPEDGVTPQPVICIICHPLSTEGGSLHNKLLGLIRAALSRTFFLRRTFV